MSLGIAMIIAILLLLRRFKKIKEHFFIILITLCYGFLIFYDLGSLKLASSTFDPKVDDEEVIIKVDESFDKIVAIAGIGDNNANEGRYQIYYRDIDISGSDTLDGEYTHIYTLDEDEYYKYTIADIATIDFEYIKIKFPDKDGVISELWLLNDDKPVEIEIISYSNGTIQEAAAIFDEQDTLPIDPDFMDETYFDEVYHARNAQEIASGQKMYTAVHPLLGTSIIALGIKIFGTNMFGFRFFGALFSTLMLPIIYLLAKEFLSKKWSYVVVLLFSFDFMHYTTGRIATLEPFSVFFIMTMFLFMIRALKIDYTKDLKKHFIYLMLSGIFMSFAISTKWTGAYGAIGLAIVYVLFELRYLLKAKKEGRPVLKKTFCLFLWSVLFFIIVPLIIYTVSFLFVPMYAERWTDLSSFLDQVLRYNTYMFEYHTGLESTHPYSSRWYMWLFDIRPIWYYVKRSSDYIQTISCFNNPLISFSGIIATTYLFITNIKKRDYFDISLLTMFLTLLVPWIFVTRTSFAYHYYPCVPFLIIILVKVLNEIYDDLEDRHKKTIKKALVTFIALCGLLFIIFLPIIGGFKTSYIMAQVILRWLPSWYFG